MKGRLSAPLSRSGSPASKSSVRVQTKVNLVPAADRATRAFAETFSDFRCHKAHHLMGKRVRHKQLHIRTSALPPLQGAIPVLAHSNAYESLGIISS